MIAFLITWFFILVERVFSLSFQPDKILPEVENEIEAFKLYQPKVEEALLMFKEEEEEKKKKWRPSIAVYLNDGEDERELAISNFLALDEDDDDEN